MSVCKLSLLFGIKNITIVRVEIYKKLYCILYTRKGARKFILKCLNIY